MEKRTSAIVVAALLLTGGTFAAQQAGGPKAAAPARGAAAAKFSVFEASIADMQAAMKSGRTTSHEIVQQYLNRIATYEDKLHAAITVNPNALAEADALDRERAQGRIRGPLHGIPIALKDNIHTTNMPTTGGALAFDGMVPPYEATLTTEPARRRRDHHREDRHDGAGELRRGQHAHQLQLGSGLRLQSVRSAARSADDRRRAARSSRPAGRAPASGRRRTSGRATSAPRRRDRSSARRTRTCSRPSSRPSAASAATASFPITADQDTPGPMAKYVMDVAIMFGALEGASADPNDAATKACTPPPGRDYTKLLRADGLKGARIGIPRANYYEPFTLPGTHAGRAAD